MIIAGDSMHCPGCAAAMQHLAVDGVLGAAVEIDLCMQCRAFWFDPFEDLHLTPASTLKLFGIIADQSGSSAGASAPRDCRCPRCGRPLHLAHDRQRNTPFQYWRCEEEHGRFTPFIDFLREKDYIRPLAPEQLAELRQNVRVVNCSNCGAPIDLTHDSACAHCGSPVSVLDVKKMVELAKGLDKTNAATPEAHRVPPVLIFHEPASPRPFDLIEAGLSSVAQWLTDLLP